MTMPPFSSARAGYAALWGAMQITPLHLPTVQAISYKLHGHKATYEAVQAAASVPWFVVALIDEMEGGGNANTHLHNGDPLSARTVHVPAGRPPPPAEPPFTFLQSAIDALRFDGLDQVTDWTVERVGYELEKYNGSGYFSVNINSPYLWSFTNQYISGKYVSDGQFDPSAVSQQAGAMAILKELMAIDSTILAPLTPVIVPPRPTPEPQPMPISVIPPPTPIPVAQTMLGLTLQQWATALANDPTLMADAAKLPPEALVVVQRMVKAVQGGS